MSKDRIDEALTRHFARDAGDAAGATRVMAKLGGPLPRQKHATRWPQILLDWQFAPAWPRMAALACCAGLGFAVGSISLDRWSGPVGGATGNDLTSVVSEPEPLTGVRP